MTRGEFAWRSPPCSGCFVLAVPVAGAADGPNDKAKQNAQTTEIQILGLNDFHGAAGAAYRLESAASDGTEAAGNAGGVEYFATHVRTLRATNPNTLFVSAGDLIGASPLISALFHDEPSIEAFNLMRARLQRRRQPRVRRGRRTSCYGCRIGGCHPVDGCQDGDPFTGATFDFLAANVKYKDETARRSSRPTRSSKFHGGSRSRFIGMTLEGTPKIVTPAGISQVEFLDEADDRQRARPES